MKNPWKRLSKINPQREDGTRQINTDVLNALVKAKLPTTEMSVVLTVISKTWGFNKQSDAISVSQITEATGFTHRAIQKANAVLIKKRIIAVKCSLRVFRGSPLNEYMFNKHYDTWKVGYKKRVNAGAPGEQTGKKGVNKQTPTIETIQKKEKIIPDSNESGTFYLTKKKRKLTGKRLDTFETFWKVFDYKKGKADAADSWYDITLLNDRIADLIFKSAEYEASKRDDLINSGGSPKWAQGWLTSRRWEDELPQDVTIIHHQPTAEDLINA